MDEFSSRIYGCVLMGGLSRRFGGSDKSQLRLGTNKLIDHVIGLARTQVDVLALSGGQKEAVDIDRHSLPVLKDQYRAIGPMAGLHAGMKWAQLDAGFIATFACDTPSFPADMVKRLAHAAKADAAAIALPRHRGRIHTALGLWSTKLLPELERAISASELAFTRWALDNGAVLVDFDDSSQLDFFNINSPEDAQHYRLLLEN